MFRLLSLVSTLVNLLVAHIPKLARLGALAPLMAKTLKALSVLLVSPITYIGLVVGASAFPDLVNSVMEIIGAGLFRLGLVAYGVLSGMVGDTGANDEIEDMSGIVESLVDQLPEIIVNVMGYFHFLSLLGTIISTSVLCALILTISRLVKR